jgi:hypothetical protein
VRKALKMMETLSKQAELADSDVMTQCGNFSNNAAVQDAEEPEYSGINHEQVHHDIATYNKFWAEFGLALKLGRPFNV